jgi:hypothetical protein
MIFLWLGAVIVIKSQKSGGMSSIDSDIGPEQEKVPLTGAKRDAAIIAMETPGFLDRLTVRIMKLAATKGFYNPFDDQDVDLPGGESAGGLASSIIEKALDGSYNWDDQKHPDFYKFCCSRAESILSNSLAKNRRVTTMSPVEEDGDEEEPTHNPVNQARDGHNIYDVLRFRDGGRLGDQLLEDFALSLQHSQDQAIVMAVHDDRECISRAYCRGKLGLSERDYDAAMKRIRRAGRDFLPGWCKRNNVKAEDQKEAR